MADTIQFRRGTTVQNAAHIGSAGEITVDTDKQAAVVHSGAGAGTQTTMITEEQASDIISELAVPGDNLLINGGFDIWQRGESGSIETGLGEYYQCDRTSFKVLSGEKARNWKSNNVLPDGNSVSALRWTGYDAPTQLDQRFKQEYSSFKGLFGKELTLSFYYRTNEDTPTDLSLLINVVPDGTTVDGALVAGILTPVGVDVVNKYSFTFTMPAQPTLAETADGYVLLRFLSNSNIAASKSVFISQLKLELGSVATPYQARPIGEELALCQRYYETGRAFLRLYSDSGRKLINVPYIVTKRSVPAVTRVDLAYSSSEAGTVISTVTNVSDFVLENDTGATAIGGSWTADAEIY